MAYYNSSAAFNRKKPLVTYGLIGLLGVIYLADIITALWLFKSFNSIGLLGIYGIKVNEYIQMGQVWRLFTPNLLHSGLMHIAMNCFGLYIWGRYIESFYGRGRYVAILILSGLMCVALSFALSSSASLGASGMVYGLYGALFGIRRFDKRLFNAMFGMQLMVFIGISVFLGFTQGYVDNFGHIGGLLGGFLASRVVCLLMEEKPTLYRFVYGAVYLTLFAAALYIGMRGGIW